MMQTSEAVRSENFTLLVDERPHQIEATIVEETLYLAPETLTQAVGWSLEPEGLCRDGMCIVVPMGMKLEGEQGLDLTKIAQLLQRPIALDIDHCVAVLGTSAAVRAGQLASLRAPDFALPDLDGNLHSLSDYRGRKVLLVAYASW